MSKYLITFEPLTYRRKSSQFHIRPIARSHSCLVGMSASEERFTFGKNWSDYVAKYYSPERLRTAQGHLLEFLKLDNLNGRSFLDIGCGSGLHSLAAWRSGSSSVF